MPDKLIVASAEVIPEFREFERTSTAALVGYLQADLRALHKQESRLELAWDLAQKNSSS